MKNYIKRSAELARVSSLAEWCPDRDLNQILLCLKEFNYSINFTNMFGELEASISVFILAEGRTVEAKGNGKTSVEAGYAALCELIDLLGDDESAPDR